jgi:hypothetical protein
MTFTTPDKTIKAIRPSDPDFIIVDGFMIADRAGFEISNNMPYEYKLIIYECLKNKWLKPIAYMKESEYIWEKLGE